MLDLSYSLELCIDRSFNTCVLCVLYSTTLHINKHRFSQTIAKLILQKQNNSIFDVGLQSSVSGELVSFAQYPREAGRIMQTTICNTMKRS